MEALYQQMLQRCRTLVHKEAEIADQYRKLDLAKVQIETEMLGGMTYLKTGLSSPFVKRGLQEIAEQRKELKSPGKRAQKVVESKTHVIIRLLQQHGQEGLEIDEIMTLLQSQGAEIDRNYVTTILGKLRKRSMAVKNSKKFCITEPGNKPTTAIATG